MTLSIFSPFEQLMRQVSSPNALASDVIPSIAVLQRLLTKEMKKDNRIKTMKNTLHTAVKRHVFGAEQNPLYCIGTVIDPR